MIDIARRCEVLSQHSIEGYCSCCTCHVHLDKRNFDSLDEPHAKRDMLDMPFEPPNTAS